MLNIFKNKAKEQTVVQRVENVIIPEAKNVVIPKFRQPTFTIAVGKKNIGKTFTTKKKAKEYVRKCVNGNNPTKSSLF